VEREHAYGRGGDVDGAIATVRAIYDAFERRDVEAALEHVHADIEFVPSGTASRLGRTEPYVGHDGLRRYFRDVERVWQELTLHADDIRATAEGVVVFGTATGIAEGRPVTAQAIWIWRVRDGKAASMRVSALGSPG
jgi:ketosteroid isomerase-like protein